jgi:hypothetical protein
MAGRVAHRLDRRPGAAGRSFLRLSIESAAPDRDSAVKPFYARRAVYIRCEALSFATTQWTLVVAAGGDDRQRASALATLCETYCIRVRVRPPAGCER